jgi:CheY-like chemotaxis protein
MAKDGPIIIVEDNKQERSLYEIAFKNLLTSNPVHFFENGKEAFDYLQVTRENPFLIICDLTMPAMEGLELRQRISDNPYLKKKATPFVFRTGSARSIDIDKAYELSVQGFFIKCENYEKMQEQLKMILKYWHECLEPNDPVDNTKIFP